MNEKKKVRITRILFLLNGMLFILGAVDLINYHKFIFAFIQFAAAVLNFAMLINFKDKRINRRLGHVVLLMNIIVGLSIALDYYLSGKVYIQYAWILAALISAIALRIQLRNQKKIQQGPENR